MSKKNDAASEEELKGLHGRVVRQLNRTFDQAEEEDFPLDAATIGVAIKMLKDNNISATPADNDDLQKLRDKLTGQNQENANARDASRKSVLEQLSKDAEDVMMLN